MYPEQVAKTELVMPKISRELHALHKQVPGWSIVFLKSEIIAALDLARNICLLLITDGSCSHFSWTHLVNQQVKSAITLNFSTVFANFNYA